MAVLSDVYLHAGHMHETDLHREKGILTQSVNACLLQALRCPRQLEGMDRASPMVALDTLCQLLHSPLLTHPAQHGLQLILMEGLQRLNGEHIIEALPACTAHSSAQHADYCTWSKMPGVIGALQSSRLAEQRHGWQIHDTAMIAERLAAGSMGRRSISAAPESLHLGCDTLVQGRIDNCINVVAHIVAIHNELRAALHQLILWIPYRTAGCLVRMGLATGWSIPPYTLPTHLRILLGWTAAVGR